MVATVAKLWSELILIFLGLPLVAKWHLLPVPPVFVLFGAVACALLACWAYLKDWEEKAVFKWR